MTELTQNSTANSLRENDDARPIATEMADLISGHDWSGHALEPTVNWPQSLKIALQIMLGLRQPAWLGWGPELILFYNDACAGTILGEKHPGALGRPAREVWSESWDAIGPPAESVVRAGAAVCRERLQLFLKSRGSLEERYCTFSYSPVPDDLGGVGGILCIVTDDTAQIRADRTLRETMERERRAEGEISRLNRDLQRRLDEFGALLNVIPVGIAVAEDPSCQRVWSNPTLTSMLQVPKGASVSLSVPEDERPKFKVFENGEEVPPHELPLQKAIATGQEVCGSKLDVLLEDASWMSVLNYAVPLYDETGTVRGGLYVGVDVTEHEWMQQALREAERRWRTMAETLEEAGRCKDEFLAMLSHELRNPLAPIRSAAQTLRLLCRHDAHLMRFIEMIDRQVEHMVRLVDDLLDVSRITRGKITLHKQRVELATVIAAAVETSRPWLDARRQELTIDLPREPIVVEADPTRLSQVVSNLLNNAAKYTPEGGHVWLSIGAGANDATVRVRDDGAGIPAELLPKVFDLFVQGNRSLARSEGGLGIGLTLVKIIVEMHGGSVVAASEGQGRGSEFVVRLPKLPDVSSEPRQAEGGSLGDGSRMSRRVLVVDDNVDAAESMALLLRVQGHEVRTAYEGRSALDAAAAFRPQVVLLDLGLPQMDGYEVARRLREQLPTNGMALVAVTGYGQDEDRRQTAAAGFDAHLVKPADVTKLGELLAGL
jgi:signal transduction histidine kinase